MYTNYHDHMWLSGFGSGSNMCQIQFVLCYHLNESLMASVSLW